MDPTVGRGNYEFERLLDSEEAAALLHVHPESLKRLARRGKVVAAKMGGIWRFRASALEAYMGEITANTQARIAQAMAPSDPAVCAVRNRRN
jgi:excisionase family DNA binding protein